MRDCLYQQWLNAMVAIEPEECKLGALVLNLVRATSGVESGRSYGKGTETSSDFDACPVQSKPAPASPRRVVQFTGT